ncbi:MAG: hypothetical protein HRU28_17550, partial [Rhizobiales bacterium]|nr:hypothetical protein [Hyphomicrobiales bacterium]
DPDPIEVDLTGATKVTATYKAKSLGLNIGRVFVTYDVTDDAYKILPCTLIAYDEAFEMGDSLAASLSVNEGNFKDGAVKLNHHHCAKFCVLGGGSCSA